jgi:hypothetical protein
MAWLNSHISVHRARAPALTANPRIHPVWYASMWLGFERQAFAQTVTTGKDGTTDQAVDRRRARANGSDKRPCAVRRSIVSLHRRSCAWAMPRRKHVFVVSPKYARHIGIVAPLGRKYPQPPTCPHIRARTERREIVSQTQPRQTRSAEASRTSQPETKL